MIREIALAWLLLCIGVWAGLPAVGYDQAHRHELRPQRHTVPMAGVGMGFHSLRLTLTVSPAGEVLNARADGGRADLQFWPQLEREVRQWKFVPFEVNGRAVTAAVEEYLTLAPPERLPAVHVRGPAVRPDSTVEITLQRSGCYGRCPSYMVTIRTSGIEFVGKRFVAATGTHADKVDADAVRRLAKRFVDADFYSLEDSYRARVTDMPGYELSIDIDGRKKTVNDYVGQWVGMPAVVVELEEEVDAFAHTERWIQGY